VVPDDGPAGGQKIVGASFYWKCDSVEAMSPASITAPGTVTR